METKKHITAEWAKKTATEILGDKVQKQLDACFTAIENSVKRNEMSTGISLYADKLTLQELTKRGFSVKQHDDQRDGSYLNITW